MKNENEIALRKHQLHQLREAYTPYAKRLRKEIAERLAELEKEDR